MSIAGELASGPCTDTVLYEVASYATAGTVSGLNLLDVEVAKNRYLNHCSGMEAGMARRSGPRCRRIPYQTRRREPTAEEDSRETKGPNQVPAFGKEFPRMLRPRDGFDAYNNTE